MLCKTFNPDPSVAARVSFATIFCLNFVLAWLMKSPLNIEKIENMSYGYMNMYCEGEECYGVLAVHRICFALSLFHLLIAFALVGVQDTKDKHAAIQNDWWCPKVLLWLVLVGVSFCIPNGFFMFWGSYVVMLGASIFTFLSLLLLLDLAHLWSEICVKNGESNLNMWQWPLLCTGMTVVTVALSVLLLRFHAGDGCALNRWIISCNLFFCMLIVYIPTMQPALRNHNPRSSIAKSNMVSVYCTYLIMSAVEGHDQSDDSCHPMPRGSGTRYTTLFLGAVFTFLAIGFSTSKAATQSRALGGSYKKGSIPPPDNDIRTELDVAYTRLGEAGAIPASAPDEFEYEDDEPAGEADDNMRTRTRYNYAWFHFIYAMGAMHVAMLLTDWNTVKADARSDHDQDVYMGRSKATMWIRVVSSWICMLSYMWSLLAPVFTPGSI